MLKQRPTLEGLYGLHWGDPETEPHLAWIRDNYCANFVSSDHVCIEIGPGGGRWTRYLLGFGEIIAVDYHQELLDELTKNFTQPNIRTLRNNGTDFPGIASGSIDFVFSFGVFVHLDPPIIEGYLKEIARVLKPGGRCVLQYGDKTKAMAAANTGFAQNTPHAMRKRVLEAGLFIESENLTVLPHSAIICCSIQSQELTRRQVETG